MWTENDTIQKDDIVTFMAAFHGRLTLEDFSEPELTAVGWIFHQIRGRKDAVDWWAVTTGGLFYELSADDSELLSAFNNGRVTEHGFECLAMRHGHRPRNILGVDLEIAPLSNVRIA